MAENEKQQQSDTEEEPLSEDIDEPVEDEDDVEEDEDSSKSKLVKRIKKEQRKVKKAHKKAKNYFIAKLQILIAVGLLLLFSLWNKVEDVLQFLSGQTEITVAYKTEQNGCTEIVTTEGESFCVDTESFNLADKGQNYLLEEYQYSYKLRTVK